MGHRTSLCLERARRLDACRTVRRHVRGDTGNRSDQKGRTHQRYRIEHGDPIQGPHASTRSTRRSCVDSGSTTRSGASGWVDIRHARRRSRVECQPRHPGVENPMMNGRHDARAFDGATPGDRAPRVSPGPGWHHARQALRRRATQAMTNAARKEYSAVDLLLARAHLSLPFGPRLLHALRYCLTLGGRHRATSSGPRWRDRPAY